MRLTESRDIVLLMLWV